MKLLGALPWWGSRWSYIASTVCKCCYICIHLNFDFVQSKESLNYSRLNWLIVNF